MGYASACICLSTVARLHAASIVLLLEQPDLVMQLAPSNYANILNDELSKVHAIDGTAFAADAVAKLPGMEMLSIKMKTQLQTDFVEWSYYQPSELLI